MNVTINWQTIITVASVITAVVLIVKSFKKGMNYAEKPGKNEEAINELKASLEEQKKKDEDLANAVKALLRSEIIHEYNKYIDKGFMPIYARDSITDLYKNYAKLGGNGGIQDLVNKALALPTEKPNEEEN